MSVILRNINPETPRKIPLAAVAALLVLLASFSLLIQPAFATTPLTDTTPPVLTSFDFNPKAVDVTSSDATVDITILHAGIDADFVKS